MTKSKQRHKVGGAVLVMVLIVMVVLIIMLMATLTVVTTAGQRIYTKFEENQAYYSARSALDIFTQNLLSDNVYIVDGITYEYTDDAGVKKTAPMKQGLALQLDLYKIKSQGDYTNSKSSAARKKAFEELGITDDAAKKQALGFAENMLIGDDIFGGGAFTPENKNFSVSNVALNSEGTVDYIEYTVTFPEMTDGSNPYGMMADDDKKDKDGDNKTDEQVAKIKVEVLSRRYDTNPAYSEKDMMNVIKSGTVADKQALKDAIKAGNRSDDEMRLKITSTVDFMGIEGTAVLIHDTQAPPVVNSSRAVTTFGGTDMKNMNIVGGIATLDPVNWDNIGSIYGAIYAEQNWNNSSQSAQIYLTDSECYYIGGGATADNSGFKVKSYALTDEDDKNKRPFVFIDGGTFGVSNAEIGGTTSDDEEAVDLLILADPSTNVAIQGYNNFYVNGDVYCKGDVDVTGFDSFGVSGDLYIEGNLNVNSGNSGWIFQDDALIHPGVTNVYLAPGSTIFGNPVSNITTGITLLSDPIDFTTDMDSDTPDVDVKLPNGVEKTITSHGSMYNDYYQLDTSGNIKLDGSGNPTPITAEQKAFTTSKSDLETGNYSTKQFTDADVGTTATLSCAMNNGGVRLDGQPLAVNNDIDTAGAKLTYKMSQGCGSTAKYGGEGGSTSDYLYIHGGGTVELLLEPGTYWGNIVVADDTTVIVYAPSGNYYMEKFCIWSETVFNAYVNNTSIDVGMAGDNLKTPKIYYYFSDGSIINTSNAFFLTGYFYGPGASIDAVRQKFDINMEYNDKSIGAVGVSFVGSVLCKDLKYDNALGGVAYINPDAADTNNGDPILNWLASRYTRN